MSISHFLSNWITARKFPIVNPQTQSGLNFEAMHSLLDSLTPIVGRLPWVSKRDCAIIPAPQSIFFPITLLFSFFRKKGRRKPTRRETESFRSRLSASRSCRTCPHNPKMSRGGGKGCKLPRREHGLRKMAIPSLLFHYRRG